MNLQVLYKIYRASTPKLIYYYNEILMNYHHTYVIRCKIVHQFEKI